MHETDPTKRFSSRVEDYAKFRPGYPAALIDVLADATGLAPHQTVADVGSGTGILTRQLLMNQNHVFAVEPNAAMRAVAEASLFDFERFVSVDGIAEATTLADRSIHVVVAAQAFHWFDRAAAHREFARILRPDGAVALIWNTRLIDATPFMRDYERLLVERAVDYTRVDHRNVDAGALEEFLDGCQRRAIPFEEPLDLEATMGRMSSASYVPAPGHPGHDAIVADLEDAFARHARDGHVTWVYETEIYTGRVS